MTAAAGPRKVGMMDSSPKQWPVAAATLIKEGWLAGRYPSGSNKGALGVIGDDPSLICEGVARHTVDNSTGAVGAAGDVYVDELVYPLFATNLDETAEGMPAYGVDNQTFSLSPSAGPMIGIVWEVTSTTTAYVQVGRTGIAAARSVIASIHAATRIARNVVFGNVSNLAAYTVAASTSLNDNVLNVETDVVMLVGQTTVAENGLYRVGKVTAGAAPLTRHESMPAGFVLPNACKVFVSEGGVYGGSTWRATSTQTGGWTVGTDDPVFYPEEYRQTVTLASGTYTIGAGSTANPDEPLFLLSTAKVELTRNTVGGTVTSTILYAAPVASRVAGKAGTAVVVVNAAVAAGTVNASDTSTVDVLIRQ